jgi:hypothetical protein
MEEINNIIIELINKDKSLVSALSKTKLLAIHLQNDSLLLWVERELNGYKNNALPSYRSFKAHVVGTFINGQYKHNNQPISTIHMAHELDAQLHTISFQQSVENLELILETTQSTSIEFKFPSSICEQIEDHLRAMGSPNFQLIECKKTISISVISEILNKIRIILLDFLLKMDAEFNELKNVSLLQDKSNEVNQIVKQILQKHHALAIK